MVKVDCSGIVSRVAGLFHRRGFKGAYGSVAISDYTEHESPGKLLG